MPKATRARLSSLVLALFTALSAATGAGAQQFCNGTSTQVCEKHVTVKAGASVILAPGISAPDPKDCSFVSPRIETTVEPRLGRIIPKIVSWVIPAVAPNGASTGACAGKATKGLRITYTADRAARGSDEVVLRVRAGNTTATSRYIITIEAQR